MSDRLYPPARPLSVGEVLDLSFRIYRQTFVKCLLFGAFAVVANWLPNLYSILRGSTVVQSVVHPTPGVAQLLVTVIGGVLALIFPLAILYRQYRLITGQPPGGELLRALKLIGRLLLFSIMFALAVAGSALCMLPALLAQGPWRIVAAALLALPMLYVIVRLTCGYTAMVIENKSAAQSLERSWQLTRGSVLRLSVIYTVAMFLLLALYVAGGAITGFLYGVLGKGDVALIATAVAVVTVALGALASPFYSGLGLAIFGDLAVRREGADLAQRISAT